jgi:hypothetical protein
MLTDERQPDKWLGTFSEPFEKGPEMDSFRDRLAEAMC